MLSLRPPRRSASATRRASPASPSANVVLSHDAEREDLARGVRGHEPPAGPREQVLADVGRLDDHLAVVADQDGHVDEPASDARELVALPVGDLDEVVASAEEIEQHLGLARVRAVAQSVELQGQASGAADLRRFVERPRSGPCRPGAGLKQPCTRLSEEEAWLERPCTKLSEEEAWLERPCTRLSEEEAWLERPCTRLSEEEAWLERPCTRLSEEEAWLERPCTRLSEEEAWLERPCTRLSEEEAWLERPCMRLDDKGAKLEQSSADEHGVRGTCTGARTSTSTSYRARVRARVRQGVLVLVLAPVHGRGQACSSRVFPQPASVKTPP
jgi:hypothetical protein